MPIGFENGNTPTPNPQGNFLGSEWGSLSKHLLAHIYLVDDTGAQSSEDPTEVVAPLSESQFEATLNWQSPFENLGTDSKAPAMTALLQSGELQPVINTLTKLQGQAGDLAKKLLGDSTAVGKAVQDLKGRTGITKLNSRQIFSGMPPIKIPVTLHFRAWKDAQKEVQSPIDRLIQWSLPKNLYESGIVTSVTNALANKKSVISALFPSEAPTLVGFRYAGRSYAPMVIESISHPMVMPRDKDGKPLNVTVQLTLATLTAIDRQDWAKVIAQSSK